MSASHTRSNSKPRPTATATNALTQEQVQQLLDRLTNLEQENEQLKQTRGLTASSSITPALDSSTTSAITTTVKKEEYIRPMTSSHHSSFTQRKPIKIPLKHDRYDIWVSHMKAHFQAHNVLQLLDEQRISFDALRLTVAEQAVLWSDIASAIDEEAVQYMLPASEGDPYVLWHSLRKHYDRTSALDRNLLLSQLASARQQDKESISAFLARLQVLQIKARRAGEPQDSIERFSTATLQVGLLPTIIERMRLPLLLMKDRQQRTLTLAELTALALETEQELEYYSRQGDAHNPITVNAVTSRHAPKGKADKPTFPPCSHCSRTNHSSDRCFKKGKKSASCPMHPNSKHTKEECRGGKPPNTTSSQTAKPNYDKLDPRLREELEDASLNYIEEKKLSSNVVVNACTEVYSTSAVSCVIGKLPIIDSGAARTVVPLSTSFKATAEEPNVQLTAANGKPIEGTIQAGTAHISLPAGNTLSVGNALQVEGVNREIISLNDLVDSQTRNQVIFEHNGGRVINANGETLMTFERSGRLWVPSTTSLTLWGKAVDSTSEHTESVSAATATPHVKALTQEKKLLHNKLGHAGYTTLNKLLATNAGLAGNITSFPETGDNCEACKQAKSTRSAFKREVRQETEPTKLLDQVIIDKAGPISTSGINGEKYFDIIVDSYSRHYHVLLTETKDEATKLIIQWIKQAERSTNHKLVTLLTDGAKEYTGGQLHAYLAEAGIKQLTRTAHTPQHTAKAERAIRTIVSYSTAMLVHAGAHKHFWPYAVKQAVAIVNCVRLHNGKTPYEWWTGKRPDLLQFKVFGCDVDVHNTIAPNAKHEKFAARSSLCMYLGLSESMPATHLAYDPKTNKIVHTRDISFREEQFTVARNHSSDVSTHSEEQSGEEDWTTWWGDKTDANELKFVKQLSLQVSHPQSSPVLPTVAESSDAEDSNDDDDTPLRRSGRSNKGIGVFRYGMMANGDIGQAINSIDEEDDEIYAVHTLYTTNGPTATPSSYEEAMRSTVWKKACKSEMLSILAHDVWEEVDSPPSGTNIADTKWVFRVKLNADGTIDKAKARLTVRGFTQQQGKDYDETESPTLAYSTLRLYLSYAATFDYDVLQLDVETAFLNAPVHHDIYIKPPPGYTATAGKVLKLKKSLYGTKQGPRCWWEVLHAFLIELSYTQSTIDPCLYYKKSEKQPTRQLLMAVFVDDLFPAFDKQDRQQMLRDIKKLCSRFNIQGKNEAFLVLGMRVTRDREQRIISIDQEAYINRILTEYGLSQCSGHPSPSDGKELKGGDISDFKDTHVNANNYRAVVGALQYAAISTRPDIAHTVQQLATGTANPTPVHSKAALRCLGYLKRTATLKLPLGGKEKTVCAYADANWASAASNDGKSITGFFLSLGLGAFDWQAKKQPTVATSTTEAEYIAYAQVSKRIVAARQLLEEMNGEKLKKPIIIRGDNSAAINLSNRQHSTPATRHINISFHYIRECIQRRWVALKQIPSAENTSDMFTKGLAPINHLRHVNSLFAVNLNQHGIARAATY